MEKNRATVFSTGNNEIQNEREHKIGYFSVLFLRDQNEHSSLLASVNSIKGDEESWSHVITPLIEEKKFLKSASSTGNENVLEDAGYVTQTTCKTGAKHRANVRPPDLSVRCYNCDKL